MDRALGPAPSAAEGDVDLGESPDNDLKNDAELPDPPEQV
jgi:hypothetical protein